MRSAAVAAVGIWAHESRGCSLLAYLLIAMWMYVCWPLLRPLLRSLSARGDTLRVCLEKYYLWTKKANVDVALSAFSLSFFLTFVCFDYFPFVFVGVFAWRLCVCSCRRHTHTLFVCSYVVSCDEKTAYRTLWLSAVTERNLISVHTGTSCTIVENNHFCQHPFRAKHHFSHFLHIHRIFPVESHVHMCGLVNGASARVKCSDSIRAYTHIVYAARGLVHCIRALSEKWVALGREYVVHSDWCELCVIDFDATHSVCRSWRCMCIVDITYAA